MLTYILLFALFTVAVLMAVNIASRRKVTRDLRNQYRFLQTLVDSIPSPVFYKDRQGVYLGCNTAFLEMLGRNMDEIVGKTVYDVAPKDLAEVYEKADNELFEQGGEQRYETQVKFADGSIHEMFFTKSVFYDDDRQMAGQLGVMLDITDRKNAEEQLKEAHAVLEHKVVERTHELNKVNEQLELAEKEARTQKEFLELVINSIDHGIVVIDANNHKVKLANTSASGGKCAEGLYCYELLHKQMEPCEADVDHCPLNLVQESGKPIVSHHEHPGDNGATEYVEIHSYPVFDESGEVAQVINTIIDVSERQRAEKATLEAKEMAEATNTHMSEFLDTASHELRTPMTSVHGFAKLTLKSFKKHFADKIEDKSSLAKAANRIEKNLEIVISESERMTGLINDQLDLSKLQSGKIEWRQDDLAPCDLLGRAQAASASLFTDSSVRFEMECDEGLPVIQADSDRLLQVMLNLISNAAKFTEEGAVGCKAILEKDRVVFSVSDTGPGIPLELQEEVFNKFKQINSKVKGKPAGTGLGLAISKEIVLHHGGEIWLESDLGQGSTFFFSIPVISVEA